MQRSGVKRNLALGRAEAKELVRRRLEAQALASGRFARAAEAVAWFGALQAQDYLGALWAVGLRCNGVSEADVERALAEREIVRSWPMRGTLHFLAAEDARWMLELLAPRALARAAPRLRKLGLDAPTLSRARRALVAALEGGRALARPDAYRTLEAARVSARGERGLHLLWHFAHEGLLCFGPRAGKQQTFVLLEEWVPNAKGRPREEALGELARRYFTAHGPATLRDFAWWSGLTLAEAREAVGLAGSRLERESFGDEPHWFASRPPPAATREAPRAHALPAFDEFFVGYADRSAALAPGDLAHVTAFQLLAPALLVDGRLLGTWQRKLARGAVVFTTKPLAPLSSGQASAVRRALVRYAGFIER